MTGPDLDDLIERSMHITANLTLLYKSLKAEFDKIA